MTPEQNPFSPGLDIQPDIKIDKPGGEGGTAGFAPEAAEFPSFHAGGLSGDIKIDKPGGEGGTAG
jgi:hypothetical protein